MTAIQKTARMSLASQAIRPIATSGASKAPTVSSACLQAERAAANLGRRFVGDHRVARAAADALADAVGEAREPSAAARCVASGNRGFDSAARP